MATQQNPFRPGPGAQPAYMVGRTEERESIDEALQSIIADRDENGLVPLTSLPQVIVGPRGVGKTLLLKLTKKQASSAGVHTVELNESLLTGPEEILKDAITPSSRLDKFKGFLEHFRGAVKLEDLFQIEIGPSGNVIPKDLRATMAAGALASPMAIFLDEAHVVPPERMRVLCNAAQSVISDGCPMALYLAGTPGLLSLLMNMGGTFMERSEILSINLITADETREALSKGFEGSGFAIDDDALELLANWSDNYPYFVQLAGNRTWKMAAKSGSKTVALEVAKAGLERAAARRKYFYSLRRKELLDNGVLKEAIQVTELFVERPGALDWTHLRDGLRRANKGMAMEEAEVVERKLLNLGFLYESVDGLEAGIPSLFDYVKSIPEMENESARWTIRRPFSKGG